MSRNLNNTSPRASSRYDRAREEAPLVPAPNQSQTATAVRGRGVAHTPTVPEERTLARDDERTSLLSKLARPVRSTSSRGRRETREDEGGERRKEKERKVDEEEGKVGGSIVTEKSTT